MISTEQLRELIHDGVEERTIDFKREPYDISDDVSKFKFIKDILAMANTPRDGSAYIIIGVELRDDGTRELVSVTQHCDDATLQDILNKAMVEPKPNFLYYPKNIDNKSFGVIEIFRQKGGPFLAHKSYKQIVETQKIYFRQGTKNAVASSTKDINEIAQWFLELSNDDIVEVVEPRKILQVPNWNEFATACHQFQDGRYYLFIIGPGIENSNQLWWAFARLPLSVVLDFDPETQSSGIYSIASEQLRNSRSLHLWTLGDFSEMVPDKACYWYAARGLSGRQSSLAAEGWRDWNRKYGGKLPDFIEEFAIGSGGRPVTVVCLWYAPEYIAAVCGMIDRAFVDAVDYVFALPESERYKDLGSQFNAELVSISPPAILQGIEQNLVDFQSEPRPMAAIPGADGEFRVIDSQTLIWLREDLEILHASIELESENDASTGKGFLQGNIISWSELANHTDADRDTTHHCVDIIRSELSKRSTIRLNLFHWPGAGGTTVSRRIGWALRHSYPIVVINRVTPNETVSRFREIFHTTKNSILCIVESADVSPDELDGLYKEVQIENIPCVFLIVQRKSKNISKPSNWESQAHRNSPKPERLSFLSQSLSSGETFRFIETYSRAIPARRSDLEQLRRLPRHHQTPFRFALAAYGRDFEGLNKYIAVRLSNCNEMQRKLLTFLSFAYYYGHKPILAQLFASYIGLPESRQLYLEKILVEDLLLELLIQVGKGVWRPMHHLVAREILIQVLTGSGGERRNWKRNLSTWGIDFIGICQESTHTPSRDLIDLLRRIFILRDEKEILGTESAANSRYSHFIDDVPTDEGRLNIFLKLVEAFPEEAHFWGHLGRFYSTSMNDPEQAIPALERAIALSPNDDVLYHMLGMCYRNIVYRLMEDHRYSDSQFENQLLNDIKANAEDSLRSFAQAREFDPTGEHAFVSAIQLIIRLVDFGFEKSGFSTRTQFLTASDQNTQWFRERLDDAEELLDSIQQAREGESPSGYVLHVRADINEIYDDYARALQEWNNLLTHPDVYAPPVRRQIARAYLSRGKRDWSALPPRDIERIIELMETNLREEPGNERNLRLWFRALRYSKRVNLNHAIDRVANWRAYSNSIESHYYLYVLNVLKAIEGSTIEQVRAKEYIEQSRQRARLHSNRTRSYEWLGNGSGLRRLVNSSELGKWDDKHDFYSDAERQLVRMSGRITRIQAPEAGTIELDNTSLIAFFVPARAGVERGRDENAQVTFFLGFSYEGLRAWSVKLV